MRGSLVVLLATVGSLLLGGLAAAVRAEVETPEAAPSITIPVGHLGDEVTYARYERSSSDEPWRPVGWESFRVNGTASALDETGSLRETVRIDLRRETREAYPAQLFVDLATRDVLKRTSLIRWNPTDINATTLVTDLGPRLEAAWFDNADPTYLWYQGDRFSTDQNLTSQTKEIFSNAWGLRAGGSELPSYRSWVARTGIIGDDQAFEIRIEGTARFDATIAKGTAFHGEIPPDWDERVPILSFRVPASSEIGFARSLWVSDSSAYPLLIDDRVIIANGFSSEIRLVLTEVRLGIEMIPWSHGINTPSMPPQLLLPQRSPADQTYPADGSWAGFCYPLSEALTDLQSSPEYPGFLIWREDHPEYYLVGFNYMCNPRGAQWGFTFAAPEGSRYVFFTQRPDIFSFAFWPVHLAEYAIFMATSGGPSESPAFDAAELPRGLITLAEANRRWTEYAEVGSLPHGAENVWGFRLNWGSSPYGGASSASEENAMMEPLHELTIGTFDGNPATPDVGGEGLGAPQGVQNLLVLDPLSGQLKGSYRENFAFVNQTLFEPSALARGIIGGDVPQAVQTAALGPSPDIGVATVLTLSLLAIFLAAYFFPLLKFFGGQLGLALPGFAKLRRSELLNNPTREALVNLVKADPGIDESELGRRVAAGWSTIVYHLSVLEKNQVVSSMIDGRHRRFFPVGEIPWGERGRIAALKNQRTRTIYELLLHDPGLIRRELAGRIGINPSAISWHIERLLRAGLVGSDKLGRRVRYYANPEGGPVQQVPPDVAIV